MSAIARYLMATIAILILSGTGTSAGLITRARMISRDSVAARLRLASTILPSTSLIRMDWVTWLAAKA